MLGMFYSNVLKQYFIVLTCCFNTQGAGRPSVSEADVSAIQEKLTRIPSKSVRRAFN